MKRTDIWFPVIGGGNTKQKTHELNTFYRVYLSNCFTRTSFGSLGSIVDILGLRTICTFELDLYM